MLIIFHAHGFAHPHMSTPRKELVAFLKTFTLRTLRRSVGDARADAKPPAAIPAPARFTTRTCALGQYNI